ncbi:MAG: hypothetical protein RMY34_22175 [Aulosira sp. DedQUE10]|nr:hypothetical protein [Aulosira sp. DedQUE10]
MPTTYIPTAGTVYCANAASSTWTIDSENVNFTLLNASGTSYTKSDISTTTITWDTTQSYVVQNPGNYSYSIIETRSNIILCNAARTKFIALNGARSLRWVTDINQAIKHILVNGFIARASTAILHSYNSGSSDPYNYDDQAFITTNSGTKYSISSVVGQAAVENNNNSSIYKTSRAFTNAVRSTDTLNVYSYTGTLKLQITDGGTQHLFDIANTNSVAVNVDNTKAIFSFTANGSTIQKTKLRTATVSLSCEQCPPNTLDCGDCCLGCNDIFNAISNTRKLLSTTN